MWYIILSFVGVQSEHERGNLQVWNPEKRYRSRVGDKQDKVMRHRTYDRVRKDEGL